MGKVFGTDGIRGKANVHPMTPEMALKVGKCVAHVFKEKQVTGKPRIVIGKDTRLSGYMIESALTSGILSMGVDVLLVGPVPTPAIAHMAKSMNCAAGIMLTASHNPAEDNGIKILDNQGFKLDDHTEEEIERHIFMEKLDNDDIHTDKIGKAFRIEDARGRYVEFAKSSIRNRSLKGLTIVLDCANGAAYKVGPEIFRELGADVIVYNNTPDGININEKCGATYSNFIGERVKAHAADVGIAFDGDADRVIFCNHEGKEVNGDFIMVILAKDMIERKKLKQNTLVVTNYSNLCVDEELAKVEGKVVRVKNGDRYVIEEMRKSNFNLGGEFSGHIIFGDYVTSGDGIITALQVLDVMKRTNKKISELAADIKPCPQVIESFDVREKIPFEDMPEVKNTIENVNQKLGSNGRTLIRYSGTQNKCRVMVEGKDETEVKAYSKLIVDAINKEVGL